MSEAFNKNVMSRLAKIGIEDPVDLILNLPGSYDDFTTPIRSVGALNNLKHNTSVYAALKLKNVTKGSGERDYVSIELTDGVRTIKSFSFGGIESWLTLKTNRLDQVVFVSGKIAKNPPFTNLKEIEVVPHADQGRIVARYKGEAGIINGKKIADLTAISLMHNLNEAVERLLDRIGVSQEQVMAHCRIPFKDLGHLLMTLHKPRLQDDLNNALTAARRINAYYGVLLGMEATQRQPHPEARIPSNRELIKELVERHPFTPTKDQRKAIWDIICDLNSDVPMDRLLSADVGNGKTMAYGIPAAYASRNGRNAVVMLPTEPLAVQVASNIQNWYQDIKVHLVTAGFKEKVNQGDVLVGTVALVHWLKKNPEWKVDLAIMDEQQKMGTAQREALISPHTHVLEATATPIPRTMALTMFANKKVSFINDSPVEKHISTSLIGNEKAARFQAFERLNQWVSEGNRAMVIYPLVAEKKSYFYWIDAGSQAEAGKLAEGFKKAGMSVQDVKPCSDESLSRLIDEFEIDSQDGFLVEVQGEEASFSRVTNRANRYFGEQVARIQFVGSRMDEELEARNRSSIIRAKEMWEKKLPGRVGMIHGRSSRAEKAQIIDEMNAGKYDVLISTTLVEIGVDVKDTRFLLVVNAENLGAFTLHQLRGRLARNGGSADFIMMTGSPLEELEEDTRNRLELLVKYTKGSDIALYDMEQRGFGSLGAGGKSQKGFDEGIFPSVKLTPSELDKFLRELAADMRNSHQVEDSPTP